MKIGGTETQRLERLFEVTALASNVKNTKTWPKGVPAKLLAKGSRVAAADRARERRERAKAVARLERAFAALLFELRGTLDATKAQVEKKQTLSAAELEAENEEDSDFIASESDDDDARDDPVNNPLRLPLGFDGKPIPCIGCTSFTDSTWSSRARSAATTPTGGAGPTSGTSRSPGTSTACGA